MEASMSSTPRVVCKHCGIKASPDLADYRNGLSQWIWLHYRFAHEDEYWAAWEKLARKVKE
jgi:hypothetical protein